MPQLDLTLSSTTDTQENINAALGIEPEKPPEPKPAEPEKPNGTETIEIAEEAAGESTAEAETEEHDQETPKPKKKGGFVKRIERLNREKQALADELDRLKEQLEAKPSVETKPLETPAVTGKPDQSKFQTYEEYVEALADWKFEQKQQALERKAIQERETQETREIFDAYNSRVEEVRKHIEDFDEVLESADNLQIQVGVQLALRELDNGPEVAYYLAKHPEECKAMMDMRPLVAVAHVGSIAKNLAKKESPALKARSTAPAPITPVGGAATKSSKSPDEMSFEEFKKWRSSQ